jgi:superfamily II DNA helicase RecQ
VDRIRSAGLLLDGATIVVSPLIALQKDQVDAITDQPHGAEAAVLNSTLPAAELRETMARLEDGEIEFLFLAPEQLKKPETVERLKAGRTVTVRGRRGTLYQRMGARLPPGLSRIGRGD